MSIYVYCIKEDYPYKSSITGRQFENEWVRLDPDGTITVKGTNRRGYAWDGCSPKIKIGDVYFGTSEAVLNDDTLQSKTYYASMIHDVFYQFNKDVRPLVSKLDHEYRRQSSFEIPKLSCPRRRASRLFSRRGFPLKDCGNDTLMANLDSNDVRPFVRRKEVDMEFYNILKRDGFRFARTYYYGVRAFGWFWWYSR